MNKTIWTLWMQGWNNAPDVCEKCSDSWKYHNPDWNLIQIDRENINDYVDILSVLPGLKPNNICYSDIIRLFLLKNYGGVWADATVFCNKSLDKWLPPETYLFEYPYHHRMIASWFISSDKNSYIIDVWYEAMLEYWRYRISNTDQFWQDGCWVHRLFGECYNRDVKFKEIWDSTKRMGCSSEGVRGEGPHYFVPYEKHFYEDLTEETKNVIDSRIHPVYKLSYKTNTNWKNPNVRGIHPLDEKININYLKGGTLDYLFETIGD